MKLRFRLFLALQRDMGNNAVDYPCMGWEQKDGSNKTWEMVSLTPWCAAAEKAIWLVLHVCHGFIETHDTPFVSLSHWKKKHCTYIVSIALGRKRFVSCEKEKKHDGFQPLKDTHLHSSRESVLPACPHFPLQPNHTFDWLLVRRWKVITTKCNSFSTLFRFFATKVLTTLCLVY